MPQSVLKIERPEFEHAAAVAGTRSNDEAPRMLVVDDDPSVVRLIADHCARLGFDVDTAANGLQALVKASWIRPDVLVIDVNMPEADGLSVCARLLDPTKEPLDVIVITGSRSSGTLERCKDLGAHCAYKGASFWSDLEGALVEIQPGMAVRIARAHAGEAAPQVRRRPCVLLVDDDIDVNRFLASWLERCGINVAYALSARQALRIACRDEPVVIITDYFMPNGDADYLLAKLRGAETTSNIPVIVLTGRKLSETTINNLQRRICGHPGVAQVLTKSLDPSSLVKVLRKYCGFDMQVVGADSMRGFGNN
jgi:CheY-like chemotaxis protein